MACRKAVSGSTPGGVVVGFIVSGVRAKGLFV